ncbi:MAG: urate hydroxylase PuuD [Thiolinea sp.]
MEAYIVEWLNLLGRWVHMITGIAWIGASFYFVWLDNHLQPPGKKEDAEKGVGGEVWSVHGGGFYHAQKYTVSPPALPDTLHWFKWEAYTTWLSGMFMLILIYWYSAEIYLIDTEVAELSKFTAILLGAAFLGLGWLVYDQLCKSALGKDEKKLSAAIFVYVVVAAWLLCHLFSGRGAFIHFGAMLGTIMVANVFFVIMPGQRAMVEAVKAGRKPDAEPGLKAKQRSVHNTYFTLPVLFTMISNHYATTFGSTYNWLVLIAISLAGALIRVYFVQRHFGEPSKKPLWIAGVLLLGVIIALKPPGAGAKSGAPEASAADVFTAVTHVVRMRCASCHAAEPTQAGFSAPPKGVVLESDADIAKQAAQIYQQTVISKAMPIGNLTKITEEERALLAQWYEAGAKQK